MKNKEVIDKLQEYFINECDPKIVARTLAGMMVDMNRVKNIKQLTKSEKECLFDRIDNNCKQLEDFIKNGPRETLKYIVQNSSD